MQNISLREEGCTVEELLYTELDLEALKSILLVPGIRPSEQSPLPSFEKAPVPLTHEAVTVPVMFGQTEHHRFNVMGRERPW